MCWKERFQGLELYKSIIFLLLFLLIFVGLTWEVEPRETKPIKHSVVKSWAEQMGIELWHLGNFITRRKEVQESFKTAQVVSRNGQTILNTLVNKLDAMFKAKIDAVKRMVEIAENAASDPAHKEENCEPRFEYYDSKEMLEPGEKAPTTEPPAFNDRSLEPINYTMPFIVLTENRNFFNYRVNTTNCSVHVPTNVFARACSVIKEIQWSKELDKPFLHNYQDDRTFSWQFFCSSTGVMRQFPASKWKSKLDDGVDLYDCRLRSWYIEAAASPKDMIILVDISGSMRGQNEEIAKHVVSNILETLTTNDFVNIFTFSETVNYADASEQGLIPATLGNIRKLNLAMSNMTTGKIANYTAALEKAFGLLREYREGKSRGAGCNQAIMLVSDGVPHDFNDTFREYNWPEIHVRLFTYLIGIEVPDFKLIKEMACINQGYYVHLSVPSEVREQVLKYIPVMARPLVLGRDDHPTIWSQVYADVVDPKMTDYKWETKLRRKQKDNLLFYLQERRRRNESQLLAARAEEGEVLENYNYVTTISMPVYDKRINKTHIAELLGVAGTDVPIRDIQRKLMPSMLGVNGYAFIVNNNGYVLTHPDFRPEHEGILKPAYNTIDMVELELLDDNSEPRHFSKSILSIRQSIINQKNDSMYMLVKVHMDNMRRVTRMKKHYHWRGIPNTPFALVIAFPEQYGMNRIHVRGDDEIHRLISNKVDVLSFFDGENWRIHPEWLYCRHSDRDFSTPEKELLYFLEKLKEPRWKWKDHNFTSSTGRASVDPDPYNCDRTLMQGMVFDARVTEWFARDVSFNPKDEKGHELKQRFGIRRAFLATHSGLTRWMDFHSPSNDDFIEKNKRSVDEIWYKRAVEQYFVEPQSFVFSVPFNSDDSEVRSEDILVTASHAIFHSGDPTSAPVAVVGFQFQHSALLAFFKNTTSHCGENCVKTCFPASGDPELECFVLDNHGFIIVSSNPNDTGKFLGETSGHLMQRLVAEDIYERVNITDYQAVCKQETSDNSPANILRAPFVHIFNILKWIGRSLVWIVMQMLVVSVEGNVDFEYDGIMPTAQSTCGADPGEKTDLMNQSVIITRTRLYSCDHVVALYTLSPSIKNLSEKYKHVQSCERPFIVVPIPSSNLILLVKDSICPVDDPHYKISLTPKQYLQNCTEPRKPTLYRRRPAKCIRHHPNESLINLCGHGITLEFSTITIVISILIGQVL